MKFSTLLALAAALFLTSNVTGLATTYRVPRDFSTIQQAMDTAGKGDTVLVDRGTYMENIDFKGKAIVVKSTGGPDATVIDGGAKGPVVTFALWEKSSSVLEGFTLTNGKGKAAVDGGKIIFCGGGVYCHAYTSPTIRNNIIAGNKAVDFGGAIFCHSHAKPVIKGNTIRENSARRGGGIYCLHDSAPTVSENMLYNNKAESGGAVYLEESVFASIQKNFIGENSAGEGYEEIEGETSSTTIADNTYE